MMAHHPCLYHLPGKNNIARDHLSQLKFSHHYNRSLDEELKSNHPDPRDRKLQDLTTPRCYLSVRSSRQKQQQQQQKTSAACARATGRAPETDRNY